MAKQTLKTKAKKEIKKGTTKRPVFTFLLAVLFASGLAGGYFGGEYLTKNDTFEIIGDQTIELNVGQQYQEQGVKIISFGKDISSKVVIEDNIDTTTEGDYYVKYSVDDIRYGKIVRYRYVVVSEVANEE